VPKDSGSDLDPKQGFNRFTERARNVVMAAQNEARAAGNDEIRPEHLVLGLLAEPDALAAKAIVEQGVALKHVRDTVAGALPTAADQVPDLIPYDTSARKALELSFREALRLGHNYSHPQVAPAGSRIVMLMRLKKLVVAIMRIRAARPCSS